MRLESESTLIIFLQLEIETTCKSCQEHSQYHPDLTNQR